MIDESRQYREDYAKSERTAKQLRQDLCRAFDEIALLQRKLRRTRNIRTALISIVSVLAWKSLEFLGPIALRWLGLQ